MAIAGGKRQRERQDALADRTVHALSPKMKIVGNQTKKFRRGANG
ncbi:hypothetical protein [Xanthomonas translucens]|nr:hypothetical protein [Xanthomonas translucens]MCT8269895.1 hypothetical protein [Xanthomonas translucens pv. undulosa]MCT8284035.1 hypothetical protein [Xanthomonas translucens pv. undulosa]MCT8318829.1 hypothetical protein [Xanthomonas translucens pv. undulosa]WNJ32848.1 hypothetical protein RMA82_06495 [Xanthomonas translucens pv. undulosa]